MRNLNLGVSLAFAVGLFAVGRTAGAQATPPAPPPSPAPPAAAPPAPAAPAPAAAPPAAPAAAAPPAAPAPAADPPPGHAGHDPGQTMPTEAVPAPPTAAQPAAEALDEHAKSPAPEIGGHVEAGYHLNLTNPEATDAVVLRSYDGPSGHSFLLHTAHLVLKHSFTDAVSAVIEVDGGTDAAITNGGLGLFDVQEAYATYKTDFGLSFTAGKFVTYEGIEVIEGPMNPTVTRGFLFGLAEPYTHIGAKVHYAIGEVADVGVGVISGWDLYVDNNDAKTAMFRVGLTPVPQFWAGISGYYGAERADSNDDRRLSLDLTGAVIPSDLITLNFQANYGQEPNVPVPAPATGAVDGSWFGLGVQPVLKIGGFSTGLRFEYFSDKDGTRTGAPGTDINVWNVSVAPGYTVEGWMIRAEYRFDSANEQIFNAGSGDTDDQQQTIAAAVSYMF